MLFLWLFCANTVWNCISHSLKLWKQFETVSVTVWNCYETVLSVVSVKGGTYVSKSKKSEAENAFCDHLGEKIFFSKNDPIRGNLMREIDCAHSRSVKTFVWPLKIEKYVYVQVVFLLPPHFKNSPKIEFKSVCIAR